MKKRNILILVLLMLSITRLPGVAETYSWIDDNGTVNFTENRGDIPRKYRKQVKKIEDATSDSSIIKPILPKATPSTQGEKDMPQSGTTTTLYNGKTYDQWKQELNEREVSMRDSRRNIEILDAQIKKSGTTPAMVQERNSMVEKYNGLVAEYDKTVDAVRKAGLKVEMQ